VVLFHQQQAEQWGALSDTINDYLESVRELAEQMAVNGKGAQVPQAGVRFAGCGVRMGFCHHHSPAWTSGPHPAAAAAGHLEVAFVSSHHQHKALLLSAQASLQANHPLQQQPSRPHAWYAVAPQTCR
jgi:hypothetical protein